jgi:ADP-ribose pyrophosphatase YjhB (NUDIX family)
MLYQLVGTIWRNLPRRLRYAALGLVEPKFLVTAGAVVLDEAGRVLLLKHVFHAGSGWGVPGGFIEKGEAPEAALRRELREEIGLEVAEARLVYVRTLRQPQQVEMVFVCRPAGPLGALSKEIERAEWFAPDELPPGLSDGQRDLLRNALPKAAQW